MNKTKEQWKEIVDLLCFIELGFDKLKVYGLYTPHDAKVIHNAIMRGWRRIDLFDPNISEEQEIQFRQLFPEKIKQ